MPISSLAESDRPDAPAALAVDASGRVWSHRDPLALYRFLAARNELLETIGVMTAIRQGGR